MGRTISCRAPDLVDVDGKELPGTGSGFFLHDFFARILPADRSLHALTKQARQWHRLTHNLWLTGFVSVMLVFCILLTHSWNENKAAINLISPQYKQSLLFRNDPAGDVAIMEDFAHQISALEKRNAHWRFPRLGLFASVELENQLKKRYCQRFYEHFEADVTRKIESHVADGGWQQGDWSPAERFIPFLTRKLNLMRARFEGADAQKLKALPDPDYTVLLNRKPGTTDSAAIAVGYNNAFVSYLMWQADIEPLNKSLSGMQGLLRDYFHDNQGDFAWMVKWADRQMGRPAITLNSYWRSSRADDGLAKVEPAYTRKGRRYIGHFVMEELEKAVEQPLWIAGAKARFVTWYKNNYYGQWLDFCDGFGKGMDLFATKDKRGAAIERLTGDDSPYLSLLKTLETELLPGEDESAWPSLALNAEDENPSKAWQDRVKTFSLVEKALAGDAVADNKALAQMAGKTSFKGKTAVTAGLGALKEGRLAEAKDTYKAYRAALGGFSGITVSEAQAYTVARQGFEDDPALAKSPVLAAQRSIDKLQRLLGPNTAGGDSAGEDDFWSLLTQPIDILWNYSVAKAGCHLQNLWDEEVLVETQRVYDRQRLVALLFGDKGSVGRFIQKNARPFLKLNSRRGYHTKDLKGCRIPFRTAYFKFMERGERWAVESGGQIQSNYVVDIVALPTDVNADARVRPHMTQLVVQSADGDLSLVNRQYPMSKKFNWSPAACGDVTLQIMLGDITLTKKYTGYCAFGKFLSDFKNGKKTFTGLDFPEYASEFFRLGVRQIEVLYRFEPSQVKPILRLLTSAPNRPPVRIIACQEELN